jgi:hypothetical protein
MSDETTPDETTPTETTGQPEGESTPTPDSDTGESADTPEPDPQPESDLLTGGTYDGTPGNTAGGPDVAATPGYDGDIAAGKDGASPDVNQPTIDELGGPGVDPATSLSPTAEGVPDSLSNDDDLDTAPVIVQPEDQTTAGGLEPTFVTQSTIPTGVTGSTPRFTGALVGEVISVRKVGWIGAETFDVHTDDIDELIGLLQSLKSA